MILHSESNNTYIEKLGGAFESATYVIHINGWYSGAFSERDILKAAKEHGHGVDTEAIEFFKKILEIENF